MEQPAYYAIIPANVRYDKNLKANEKLLYGEITALASASGVCWASNGYFAELYGVSKVSVSNWINKLIQLGYVKSQLIYKDGSNEIDKRFLSILPTPIKENFKGGIKENFKTPIKENFKDNNTRVNNTRVNNNYNNDDDKSKAYSGLVKIFEENGFGTVSGFLATNIEKELEDFANENDGNYREAYSIISFAIEQAVNQSKRTPAYVWKVTKSYSEKKLFTLEAVKAADAKFQNDKSVKGYSNNGYGKPKKIEPSMSNVEVVDEIVDDAKYKEVMAKLKNIKTKN